MMDRKLCSDAPPIDIQMLLSLILQTESMWISLYHIMVAAHL